MKCDVVGERAIRECVQEGRRAAEQCSGKDRLEVLQLCDDLDRLCDELADLKRRGMVRIIASWLISFLEFMMFQHQGFS